MGYLTGRSSKLAIERRLVELISAYGRVIPSTLTSFYKLNMLFGFSPGQRSPFLPFSLSEMERMSSVQFAICI